jgi:uncharacterized protein YcgI (DUF1989 family)
MRLSADGSLRLPRRRKGLGDMGRLLASITTDGAGWHDTVCGHSDARLVAEKYGVKDFQMARNDWQRNARDAFLIELAKWGLGKKDLVPNINWFSKVVADEEGRLSFVPGHSVAGGVVGRSSPRPTSVWPQQCSWVWSSRQRR